MIPSSYFVIIQLLTSQMCIIRAGWIYNGKPEPFLALVHKKNLFNTSLNGPPKNTSPESFLVGTGLLSSFTLLVSSTSRVSLCSLQCSLRHSTLSSTHKESSDIHSKFKFCCHSLCYAPVSVKLKIKTLEPEIRS